MNEFFKHLKEHWTGAAQIGAWILGIIGGFLIAPKMGAPEQEESVWKLAQFVVNVLVILLFVATSAYAARRYLRYWVVVTIVMLLLGLGAYFFYLNEQNTCTCKYYSKTVLIGTELSNPERDKNSTCEELLKDYTGAVEEIWTKSSINRCRMILASTYIATIPLFAICLISVLQVAYLQQKSPD